MKILQIHNVYKYLGGEDVAGGKMKSTGTIEGGDGLWFAPNEGATNESGFTALPAGYRDYYYGSYSIMGIYGYFWSSTEDSSINALIRRLYYSNSEVNGGNYSKQYGFSIRCLKD